MDYRGIPKVELHLHLDCSLSWEVARQLDPELDAATFQRRFIAPDKCPDLAAYLTYVNAALALLQTEEALRLTTRDLLAQLRAEHVIYAEIRFAPLLHTRQGLSPDRVVAIVTDELRAQPPDERIPVRLILCTLRHFGTEEGLETVRLATRFRADGVVGLDLAGDEAGFPITAHVPPFVRGRALGLHRTAHAGEARGADSVQETLDLLRPERLGHGVRSIEVPGLVEQLRAGAIHLEICPTSNVQTNVVATLTDHPVDELFRAGVSLSINTDGRTLSNTTLSEEYRKLGEAFAWTEREFLRCNLAAIEHAFCAPALKAQLREYLLAHYP
jgi:adenosine deaminase